MQAAAPALPPPPASVTPIRTADVRLAPHRRSSHARIVWWNLPREHFHSSFLHALAGDQLTPRCNGEKKPCPRSIGIEPAPAESQTASAARVASDRGAS